MHQAQSSFARVAAASIVFAAACSTGTVPPSSTPVAPKASPSARADTPASKEGGGIRWTMEGTLDSAQGSCSGGAAIARLDSPSAGYELCWALKNERSDCAAPDIDWLTEGAPELCRGQDGFELVGDLPGLGQCQVAQTEVVDDQLRMLTLDCTWQCRDESPCAGSARYKYTSAEQ